MIDCERKSRKSIIFFVFDNGNEKLGHRIREGEGVNDVTGE